MVHGFDAEPGLHRAGTLEPLSVVRDLVGFHVLQHGRVCVRLETSAPPRVRQESEGVEEDETIMTFQPGETPAIAARIGRSLKAVRERRRRIRNGSTVSGGQD